MVKSGQINSENSLYSFSQVQEGRYIQIPNQNIYVNNSGDTLYYDPSINMYRRNSLRPQLIAPGSAIHESEGPDMEDGNVSDSIVSAMKDSKNALYKKSEYSEGIFNELQEDSNSYKMLMHQNNLFSSKELDVYNKTYRFGYFEPNLLSTTKEFLFFTKPDLHIFGNPIEPQGGIYSRTYNRNEMNPSLAPIPFWNSLKLNNTKTIALLQSSLPKEVGGEPDDRFNHLLQNRCISNLEVPSLSSEMVETATNTYGVGFSYRGSSEASDDKPTFSLEFKDSKFLDVYYYFKAYEEYETLKHHGVIAPFMEYIEDRKLHDQMAIFKFIVDEDMETILYYGKMYGVVPKSLPRDVFSNTTFDNGLTYSIDFEAAFYEDMKPEIIRDFNTLANYNGFYKKRKHRIDIYNNRLDGIDNRPAKAAFVEMVNNINANAQDSKFVKNSPSGYSLKLRWRGDDNV